MDIGKNSGIRGRHMEAFDNICLMTGILSVGVGIYVCITKKLLGRDTGKATDEKIRQFLPYETATYILLGIFLALLVLGKQLPFFQNDFGIGVLIALSVLIIGLNIYFANKILGKRK